MIQFSDFQTRENAVNAFEILEKKLATHIRCEMTFLKVHRQLKRTRLMYD